MEYWKMSQGGRYIHVQHLKPILGRFCKNRTGNQSLFKCDWSCYKRIDRLLIASHCTKTFSKVIDYGLIFCFYTKNYSKNGNIMNFIHAWNLPTPQGESIAHNFYEKKDAHWMILNLYDSRYSIRLLHFVFAETSN